MAFKPGKLLPILLLPVLAYAVVKGVMYYNAKRAVDQAVQAAADQVDIRYTGISTDIRGAVTVGGITVQPLGGDDVVTIDHVRIASDDLLFFLRGADWQPGEGAPPDNLAIQVGGVSIPLTAGLAGAQAAPIDPANPCADGLQAHPQMLKALGFDSVNVEFDSYYRVDPTQKTLDLGVNIDVRDIQSVRMDATLSDVDLEAMAQGGALNVGLGGFTLNTRVAPEFGRQALKNCAIGSSLTLQEWSGRLAEQAIAEFEAAGLSLGSGLRKAVQDFYEQFGEIELAARPAKPMPLMALMMTSPQQIADTLGLRLSLNGKPVADTRFTWQRPEAPGLAALFGQQQEDPAARPEARPKRTIVRREYETVAVGNIARFVNHQVKITPRGLPVREGVLRRIKDGVAEVEQTVHGGKYTAYVPVDEIQSLQALIQREVGSLP